MFNGRLQNGSAYSQLSIEERAKIERWRHAKVWAVEMARVLKRHRPTAFREARHNHAHYAHLPEARGYFFTPAQVRTRNRRAGRRKLIRHPRLCERIIEHSRFGWIRERSF